MKSNKISKLILSFFVLVFMLSTIVAITNILPNSKTSYKQESPIIISQVDDNYEENDAYSSAYDISSHEQTWLSTIDGPGIQEDDDWYEIYVDEYYENLVVEVTFTHYDGDISLRVQNEAGNWIYTIYSDSDDEHFDVDLPAHGIYYILVFGEEAGNEYDLWWDDLRSTSTDDNYEINDVYLSAYDLSTDENTWLRNIDELGVQYDDDWFEITIDPGFEHLVVDCTFSHVEGDIDIGVYSSAGSLMVESISITDNEQIDIRVPSSGSYYILVDGEDNLNFYDLKWDQRRNDAYEVNNDRVSAYSLSTYEDTWLDAIGGLAYQYDDDWYRISIPDGFERLFINLTFTHTLGNINLSLYDDAGTLIKSIDSTTDNEEINKVVSSSGTYYILVRGDKTGNYYNLQYTCEEYTPNPIPGYNIWFVLSIIIIASILSIKKRILRRIILK